MTAYRNLTRYQDLDDTKNLGANQVLVNNGSGTWTPKTLATNVVDFGGIGDAKVLTDATMTAGSPVLTSLSNPFTSTDVGKLIYVMAAGGTNTPLKTTIQSYQNSGQVTLAASAVTNSTILGGPNVNAVYGTPNAAAFNAALTAAQAAAQPVSAATSRYQVRAPINIQAGSYLIESPLTALSASGVSITGAGQQSTYLYFCEAGTLFSQDVYNATPTDAYQGTAFGLTISHLTIDALIWTPGTYENIRVGTAIQDNGSGTAQLSDVQIRGFKYGFCGAYGSDFTRFGSNVNFSSCDVGFYFGPGSQQLYFYGVDLYNCREGAVFEGAPQFEFIGGSFENPLISAVTIEAKSSGTTRLGNSVTLSGASYSGSRNFRGTWFESGAGGSSRLAPRMIWINGDPPNGAFVQGVGAIDCYLVSGGTQVGGAHNSFIESNTSVVMGNQTPKIVSLYLRGNFINHIFRNSGTASTAVAWLENCDIPTGSNITSISGGGGSSVTLNGGRWTGAMTIIPQFLGGNALELQQFVDGGGTVPLMKTRAATSSTFISGIAQGGAFVMARKASTLSSNGTVTIDASAANIWTQTLAANATSASITNPTTGQILTIEWKQDGTGGRSYVWPSNITFVNGLAPSASVVANAVDTVTFYYDGTNWKEINRAITTQTQFNVKDYGAKGDGTTDDTAAITAAINAMPAQSGFVGSGILFFPPGDYRHTGITLPGTKRIHLMGAGAGISTLRMINSTNATSLTLAARTGGTDGWWHEVSNIQIDGNKSGSNTTGHGILVLSTRTSIHHCNITNCAQDGLRSDPASFALSSSGNEYHDLYLVSNNGNGIYLGLQGYDPFLTDIFSYLNGGDGINCATTNVFAKGIHVANNTGNGISLVGTTGGYGMWEDVYAHLNTLRGISISGAGETGHRFANSQLIGNGTGGFYISTTNGRIGLFASLVKDNVGPGVEIASCNFNIIDGCQFFDFQTPKTQTYGILTTGTADYQTINGNICRAADHLTGDLSLVGTHNMIVANTSIPSTFLDRITVSDGITHKTKAGTPVDGDFIVTPADATMVVDTSAAKLWVRLGGGTWKGTETLVGNPVTTKTANYTASSNDKIILADGTSAPFTITLPSAAGTNGRQYTVKKTNVNGNNITVATTSSQTIDGITTYILSNPKESVTVISDGSNWQAV